MDRGGTVYRCFDADGALLYVGLTTQIIGRLSAHHKTAAWWPRCHRVTRQDFKEYLHAHQAERIAIRDERPSENVKVFKTHNEKMQELWGDEPVPARYRVDVPDVPQVRYIVREADKDAPMPKRPQSFYNWRAKGFNGFEPDTPLEDVEVDE